MPVLPQSLRFVLIEVLAALIWLLLAPFNQAIFIAVALALILSWFWHDGRWWLLIHASFLPLVLIALRFDIAPAWYLLAFVLFWLIFSSAVTHRVPLYLSGSAALRELECLPIADARFLDLGAGTGTVLRGLARVRPDLKLTGIEQAFLPWLLGYLRVPRGARWLKGDYASHDLADYDVVYAFLSPEAMPALWDKVRAQMRPGSVFVSNTFEVPGVSADAEVELNDWKNGKLLIWRM